MERPSEVVSKLLGLFCALISSAGTVGLGAFLGSHFYASNMPILSAGTVWHWAFPAIIIFGSNIQALALRIHSAKAAIGVRAMSECRWGCPGVNRGRAGQGRVTSSNTQLALTCICIKGDVYPGTVRGRGRERKRPELLLRAKDIN